jgi:hypothetical protein
MNDAPRRRVCVLRTFHRSVLSEPALVVKLFYATVLYTASSTLPMPPFSAAA